jgi:hypothetical protein
MTPHSTAEFHMINAIAPVVFAIAFICISSLLREPDRRNFMAIMVGGAGAAYLSGGGLGRGNLPSRRWSPIAAIRDFARTDLSA